VGGRRGTANARSREEKGPLMNTDKAKAKKVLELSAWIGGPSWFFGGFSMSGPMERECLKR
jgi:hypothetical protein